LFIRLIQASIANATVIYNKLHPAEKKGSKDVVQEICQICDLDSSKLSII